MIKKIIVVVVFMFIGFLLIVMSVFVEEIIDLFL